MSGGLNGNSFEMGRMFGEMLQLQRQTLIAIDRQTDTLEDIRVSLSDSTRSSKESVSRKELGTTLQDLTHLVRAMYPVLLLLAAVGKKVIFPEAAPLLQEAVSLMSMIVSGGKS
jgi:hypothetical protein